jgi:hypothetical protein
MPTFGRGWMTDVGKREDRLLDALSDALAERDTARRDLAAEKVAHRITKKELAETAELALR